MAWAGTLRASLADVLLAAAVTALGAVEVAVGDVGRPLWATVPSVALFGLPLLIRRRYPWTALLIVYGTMLWLWLAGASQYDYLASVASALLVMFSFGAAVELAQAVAGLVVASAALTVSALQGLDSILWGVGLVVGAWAAGRAIRARRLLIEELARTSTALRESREAHARDAVAAERGRIARELHDVIAHSVGVMVVQAGAAEQMMPIAPDRAASAVRSVQDCGRQALTDLRRLLGVLRPDGDGDGDDELSPQPGLGEVGTLVERLADAGLAVRVTRSGPERPLPAGVDLAAYRIVQEGLTNVLKHAGPASAASLAVRYDDDAVDIEIRDDGRHLPGPLPGLTGAGHGLVGMRERALMYGGSFTAGPEQDGGFAVRVHLPAEPA
jgi:signal transduction histidine kinase